MVSVVRYHEVSESSHRIMNPFSAEKLRLLGEICGLREGMHVLDLACGKGEMLSGFARDFGARGTGVDLHAPFIAGARERASELKVREATRFIQGDAGDPAVLEDLDGPFDVVGCIGATWIGGGLTGTLALMGPLVVPGGPMLVGEVYWAEPPPPAVRERRESDGSFADLAGTLDRIEAAGAELVEMVLASHDDWDRYAASQWRAVADWLLANPDDPEAAEIRQMRDRARRQYLADERRCLGWGVFVCRAPR